MNKHKTIIYAILFSVLLSSCGNGNVERVKADSSVTSASVVKVQQPDAINTDTTTAAPRPVNDTAFAKQADTTKITFPAAEKKTDTGKATKNQPGAIKAKAGKK